MGPDRPCNCCRNGFAGGFCKRWLIVHSSAWLHTRFDDLDKGWLIDYRPNLSFPDQHYWMHTNISDIIWVGVSAFAYEDPPRWRFFIGTIGEYVCIDKLVQPTDICPLEFSDHVPGTGWPMCPIPIPFIFTFDDLTFRFYKSKHAAKQDYPDCIEKPEVTP